MVYEYFRSFQTFFWSSDEMLDAIQIQLNLLITKKVWLQSLEANLKWEILSQIVL